LEGARSGEAGVLSLLDDLGRPMATPSANDVLASLFEDASLVDAVGRFAPRVHHAGFIAPRGLGARAVEAVLRKSPFRDQLTTFKSAILAKDLSCRLRREVEVVVVQGSVAAREVRCPAVEVFIADLPPQTIDGLVSEEIGCHVALALEPDGSIDRVRHVLHAHGCWEIPLMRHGPLANHEIRASVLYVDVSGRERTRRLEFITSRWAPDVVAEPG
ncbi:MAG: hypothetical protein ACREQQ_13460, partial [Candidatus Binatia bacterium]